jgi:hypothetical protein
MNLLHDKEQGNYKPVLIAGQGAPLPDDNWPYHNHPDTPHDKEYGIRNPKFERHIFISRDTVMFSVDTQIQMIAESRRKEDGSENYSLTNATTKYQQMFYDWFNKHIGKAKSKMQSFVLEKFKTTNINTIKDKEEVDIELLMPLWWDDTVFDQLTNAVNDYVVNAILQEFFTITLTSKDPVTIDKATLAADALSDIRKYSNASKPGTIRKHLSPF